MDELQIRIARAALVDRVTEELANLPIYARNADRAAAIVDLLTQPRHRVALAVGVAEVCPSELAALEVLLERIQIDETGGHLLTISSQTVLAARRLLRKISP